MDAILPHLPAISKKQALKQLAQRAADVTALGDREIYNVLMAREQLGCTGMGAGVCIPHGRFEALQTVHAFFATLAKPIEFGAADGKPVDLIFLLLTPASANNDHLKALATVSRLLRDKPLCEKLRATHDAKAIYALLTTES